MSAKRRSSGSQRPSLRGGTRDSHSAASSFQQGRASSRFRVRWVIVKNIAGVLLLPVVWVWTEAFLRVFSKEASRREFWMMEEVWFFGMGVVGWLLWFTWSLSQRGEPHGMRVYVMGHEWTHAIWAWLCGGRVEEIHYGREGGHVLTDKPNFWVTLAPYFYPIYSVALVLAFVLALPFYRLYPDWSQWWVNPWQVWFALLGGSWAFHLSFTVWMIHLGQSDLRLHGNFFSLVLIYGMNLVVLSVPFLLVAPEGGIRLFGRELLRSAEDFSEVAWELGRRCWERF